MTGFAAVATTGIYCRPGCAARPSPQNVRQFLLAAAAKAAGYRACLRRRPYRAEPPVSWSGPEPVCRAVQLIDDTDLMIADIAFASGFGSVRRLNRACQEVFRATPRELRARRRISDRLVTDGGLLLRLPFQAPLEREAMLSYFTPQVAWVIVSPARLEEPAIHDPAVAPGGPMTAGASAVVVPAGRQ